MKPPPDGAAEFLFVGNATLLIRYGALKLLTDPNFLHRGQYAYLGKGLMSWSPRCRADTPPAGGRSCCHR